MTSMMADFWNEESMKCVDNQNFREYHVVCDFKRDFLNSKSVFRTKKKLFLNFRQFPWPLKRFCEPKELFLIARVLSDRDFLVFQIYFRTLIEHCSQISIIIGENDYKTHPQERVIPDSSFLSCLATSSFNGI